MSIADSLLVDPVTGRSYWRKLGDISWSFLFILCCIAIIGFAMLYSVAGGSFEPWAKQQIIRFCVSLVILIGVAVVNISVWLKLSYAVYAGAFLLLIAVEFVGQSGMGAQRWIDLGFMNLQPSEIMRIAMIMALARYCHGLDAQETRKYTSLIIPLLLIAVPSGLVLLQPDLGTSLMMILAGIAVIYAAGFRARVFVIGAIAGVAAIPIVWRQLHAYQQERVLTFLNPESDPLGAGYHIIQSKIALGSGGISGKGYMQGTQSQLDFLPEQQTDFIFTMLAEELGMMGALILIGLYVIVVLYGYIIAFSARNYYGRLLSLGVVTTFFSYVFMNIAMVMGLVPVVGLPLPLVSYGGTSMLTTMVGFGLMMSAFVHKDMRISRTGLVR